MVNLPVNQPNMHAEFRAGSNNFSAMAIDRCHVEDNGASKYQMGAVGLSENPAAFRGMMDRGGP